MSTQMDQLGLPPGRYTATLEQIGITGRGKKQLALKGRLERTGAVVVESHTIGEAGDPYALSRGQRKVLRETAERLGVTGTGPAETIIAALKGLKGQQVRAYVRPSPMGVVCSFSRNGDEPQDAVSGEVLDRLPDNEPEFSERTERAQTAHEQLLTGLRHANAGLALAAQACHSLRLEEGWSALGYDSMSQYLADPEIGMSRTTFYNLADIWEQYVVRGGQDQRLLCSPTKLEIPLPALKAGEVTPEEALTDAQTLGQRDLRIKYRGEHDPTGEPQPIKVELPVGCAHCGAELRGDDDFMRKAD